MGFVDSFKNIIGIEGVEEDIDDITEEEVNKERAKISKEYTARINNVSAVESKPSRTSTSAPMEKKFSMSSTNTSSLKLVVIEPKAFEDCPKLVDSLKGRRPVIINLEKLDTEVARKIFDFLNGATYALNGNVQKIANNIFVFAPENVSIAANQDDKAGFDFNKNKSPWR